MRSLIAIITLLLATTASAASKQEIDAHVRESLEVFQKQTSAGHELSIGLFRPDTLKHVDDGGHATKGRIQSKDSGHRILRLIKHQRMFPTNYFAVNIVSASALGPRTPLQPE